MILNRLTPGLDGVTLQQLMEPRTIPSFALTETVVDRLNAHDHCFGLEDLLGGEGGILRFLKGMDQDLGCPIEAIASSRAWPPFPGTKATWSPDFQFSFSLGFILWKEESWLNPWSLVPLNGALTDEM